MFVTHTEHVIIDINGFQKRQRKPKGQSGIDNPETRATLDIQDTGRKKKPKKQINKHNTEI